MCSPVTFRIREKGPNVAMFRYITFASLYEIRFLASIHALVWSREILNPSCGSGLLLAAETPVSPVQSTI